MKFHQRISLITYLTVIIFAATSECTVSISKGWGIVLVISLALLFNIFVAHTEDD